MRPNVRRRTSRRSRGLKCQVENLSYVNPIPKAPAPVIADALGDHPKHVAKVWTETGDTWKTYAPGDHSR
jgi:hypothetical protein